MATSPIVSVIVPNYRHARYLPRRLDSILAQTVEDWELIILDDASPDDSVAVIARYLGNPKVRFIPNETNSGDPFVQWKKGLAGARGEFIWLAESDDFAAPTFLERLLALAEQHPTAGIVYCQSEMVDEEDRPLFSLRRHYEGLEDATRWDADFFADGRDEVVRYFSNRNPVVNASACLFRREAFARAGGPATGYRLCGDWLTYIRILEHADIAFCADTLNFYRLHQATARRSSEKMVLESIETYEVLSYLAEHFPLDQVTRQLSAARTFQRLMYLLQESGLRIIPGWERLETAARRYDPFFDQRLAAPAAWRPQVATLFFDELGHFSEQQMHQLSFPPGAECTLRFGPCRGRFRLDPISAEGRVTILELVVRDAQSHEIWRADADHGFAHLQLEGTAVRLPAAEGFAILAWGLDPIVLAPGFLPPADGSSYWVEARVHAGASLPETAAPLALSSP